MSALFRHQGRCGFGRSFLRFDVISDLVKKRFNSVVGAEPKLKWIEFLSLRNLEVEIK